MKKQTSSICNWILLFLTQKINTWIILVSSLILAGSFFFFFHKEDLILFPNNNSINIDFYNDSVDGGHSKVLHKSITDTSIFMSFVLNEGFVKPYVGININSKNSSGFALSNYNQIQIEVSGKNIKDIVVYLVAESKNERKESNANIHFGQNLELTNSRARYILQLDQFKIPDWWYDVNNITLNQYFKMDLDRVTNINIATGLTSSPNSGHFLQIYSIKFGKNNTRVILQMFIMEFLIISVLALVHFLRFRNRKKEQHLIIAYKPIEVGNKELIKSEDFFDYIHNNFNNSELNLIIIAKETGFNQRHISESISQKFNCNVKTYINQIRIKEAQRLLSTTDLNISEIAYMVGFNSPNNFNRVFKKLTGINPSDFVQNKD